MTRVPPAAELDVSPGRPQLRLQVFRETLNRPGGLAQRLPDLAWPAVAYVCHVSDNLRIWAERLAGLAAGDTHPVPPYDQDLLARARSYDEIASEMSCSPAVIRKRVSRGLAQLREQMTQEGT